MLSFAHQTSFGSRISILARSRRTNGSKSRRMSKPKYLQWPPVDQAEKTENQWGKKPVSVRETHTEKRKSIVEKPTLRPKVGKPTLLSISRGGARLDKPRTPFNRRLCSNSGELFE